MPSQIDDYVKRPIQYQNIDGIGELLFGVLLTGLALLQLFWEIAPSGSIWRNRPTLAFCSAAFVLTVLYGNQALKKRITYPRTGYVKYREAGTIVWRGFITANGIALFYVFAFHHVKPYSFEIGAVAVGSAAWGLIYALVTRLNAAWRWIVLVALIVVPPVVATLPLGRLWLDNLSFMLQGLILFVSGAITLTLYLRRNPVPEQVTE